MELTFQVVPGLCAGCGACLRTCPEHAVRVRPDPLPARGPVPDPLPVRGPLPDPLPGTGLAAAADGSAASESDTLSNASGRPPVILAYLCTGCGECMEVCPVDAIEEVAVAPMGHVPGLPDAQGRAVGVAR